MTEAELRRLYHGGLFNKCTVSLKVGDVEAFDHMTLKMDMRRYGFVDSAVLSGVPETPRGDGQMSPAIRYDPLTGERRESRDGVVDLEKVVLIPATWNAGVVASKLNQSAGGDGLANPKLDAHSWEEFYLDSEEHTIDFVNGYEGIL